MTDQHQMQTEDEKKEIILAPHKFGIEDSQKKFRKAILKHIKEFDLVFIAYGSIQEKDFLECHKTRTKDILISKCVCNRLVGIFLNCDHDGITIASSFRKEDRNYKFKNLTYIPLRHIYSIERLKKDSLIEE